MPAVIAMHVNRKSTRSLVEFYISPMVERILLERTIPGTPSHPAQRYRATPQGIQDLLFDEEPGRGHP